ncbi:unnamed protein product [Mytilus coruscus]|uniref:Zinc finger DNA binding protein n=1 Tax=Mytilus coruscus TaxID=42192 RepID=A0A6J8DC43_MYTCO|nr:unnamed protein product [Mytilus coruscus]
MAASTNKNNDEVNNSVVACSQPITPSQTLVIPTTNKKRGKPESPDQLPATQKQESRQMRRRNSYEDLSELGSKRGAAKKTSAIAEKVLEALRSPDVLNQVIPILSNKISESISSLIDDKIQCSVDEHIKPLNEKIEEQREIIKKNKQKICIQFIKIDQLERSVHQQTITVEEQNKEIDLLYQKVAKLEDRMEKQEQYSRRTSLRFNKISVPVDERGRIQHPVNTDELILNVCNNKLGLNLTLKDINRSHTIGKARYGKAQVIVRFVSYRVRHQVYSNKKALKGDPEGIFITENLTPYRTELVTRLAQLKYNGGIHTYWTADGRIFVMKTQASRRKIIEHFDDISRIEHAQNDTNSSDQNAEGGED